MISLRSAASTAWVSAPGRTPFSGASYLYSGIALGGAAGAHRIRLTRRIVGQGGGVGGGRALRGRLDGGEGRRVNVQRVMAGRQVPRPVVDEGRLDLGADLGRVAAAGVEPAAARRVDRARD